MFDGPFASPPRAASVRRMFRAPVAGRGSARRFRAVADSRPARTSPGSSMRACAASSCAADRRLDVRRLRACPAHVVGEPGRDESLEELRLEQRVSWTGGRELLDPRTGRRIRFVRTGAETDRRSLRSSPSTPRAPSPSRLTSTRARNSCPDRLGTLGSSSTARTARRAGRGGHDPRRCAPPLRKRRQRGRRRNPERLVPRCARPSSSRPTSVWQSAVSSTRAASPRSSVCRPRPGVADEIRLVSPPWPVQRALFALLGRPRAGAAPWA